MDVTGRGPLSKHVFDHFAEDVSEAEVTALVAIGEAFVVDAELMEDGSLQVVDVNGVLGNVDAVIVGLAVGDTPTHSATGEPVGEAVGMMVAAIGSLGELALAVNGAAKFSAPDNESIVEHAALPVSYTHLTLPTIYSV